MPPRKPDGTAKHGCYRAVIFEMFQPTDNAMVAVFDVAADAETAVSELRRQGVEPGCLSVVAADEPSGLTPVSYYFERGCLRKAATQGSRRLLESLPACAVLIVPGERTALLAGPFAASVVRALENEGLFADLGPIAGALYSLGIPRDAAREYELAAHQGRALVIVHGRARDVAQARSILAARLEGKLQLNP